MSEDELTEAERKFQALQRDPKAWSAWCAGRLAAWLKAHPNWKAERQERERLSVKTKAK